MPAEVTSLEQELRRETSSTWTDTCCRAWKSSQCRSLFKSPQNSAWRYISSNWLGVQGCSRAELGVSIDSNGPSLWPKGGERTFVEHNNAVKRMLLPPFCRWAKRWSIQWQYIIHPCSRSHVRKCEAGIQTPAFLSSSLTTYVMLGIVSFFEISPSANFFIYFLWAITGSSHALKCQHVSISKTCHFHMNLTPRAKIG